MLFGDGTETTVLTPTGEDGRGTIDWVPGTGTIISVRGVQQGEPFKEPEFYTALMRIWLGPNPADWKLKDALLGKGG